MKFQMRALLVAAVACLLVTEALAAPRPFANAAQHKMPEKAKDTKGADTAKNVFAVLKKFSEKKAQEKAEAAPKRMLLQKGPSSDSTADSLANSIQQFYVSVGQSVARQLSMMHPKGGNNIPKAL